MIDGLLEALGAIGYALDTPGAYTRGLLAGRPGERVDGRDLLQAYGLVGNNREGLDAGDVGGFLAEMVLDPLNLLSAPLAGAKALRHAKRAMNAPVNMSRRKLIDAGMTDALFAASPLRNEPKEVSKAILGIMAQSKSPMNVRTMDAYRSLLGLNPVMHKRTKELHDLIKAARKSGQPPMAYVAQNIPELQSFKQRLMQQIESGTIDPQTIKDLKEIREFHGHFSDMDRDGISTALDKTIGRLAFSNPDSLTSKRLTKLMQPEELSALKDINAYENAFDVLQYASPEQVGNLNAANTLLGRRLKPLSNDVVIDPAVQAKRLAEQEADSIRRKLHWETREWDPAEWSEILHDAHYEGTLAEFASLGLDFNNPVDRFKYYALPYGQKTASLGIDDSVIEQAIKNAKHRVDAGDHDIWDPLNADPVGTLASILPRQRKAQSGLASSLGLPAGYDSLFGTEARNFYKEGLDVSPALDRITKGEDTYLLKMLDEIRGPKDGTGLAQNWVDRAPLAKSLGYYHAATQPPQLTQGTYEAEPYQWEQRLLPQSQN